VSAASKEVRLTTFTRVLWKEVRASRGRIHAINIFHKGRLLALCVPHGILAPILLARGISPSGRRLLKEMHVHRTPKFPGPNV
jgi:hypothetical protein